MSQKEEQSRKEVWKMFDQISPRYDLINHLLSFGADIYWRRRVISHLPKREKIRLLDLATGTGEQLIEIIKRATHVQMGLGIDLSKEMLRLGEKKVIDQPYANRITFAKGDATNLSSLQEGFDCITMSFGIRNVTDVDQCLRECFRVLGPSGRLMILEFSIPKNRLIRKLHLFYLRSIVPFVGGWLSRSFSAYRYLYQTIQTFPCSSSFCNKLKRAGFKGVQAHPLTFGITTLYIGEKGD